MPLDSHGNFYPVFPGMPAFAPSDPTFRTGAGVPSNDLGENGDVYTNITTGDIYIKSGDAWTVLPGGSGEAGVGSPEGVVTAPVGTTYTDTGDGSFWAKVSGAGNTGWLGIVGPAF